MSYFQKYLKYKNKYLELKKQIGGAPKFNVGDVVIVDRRKIGRIRDVIGKSNEPNIYRYNITFSNDEVALCKEELSLIVKPSSIKDDAIILQPGQKVTISWGTTPSGKIIIYGATIKRIRGHPSDEFYEVEYDQSYQKPTKLSDEQFKNPPKKIITPL
jgi:hypothetical protein